MSTPPAESTFVRTDHRGSRLTAKPVGPTLGDREVRVVEQEVVKALEAARTGSGKLKHFVLDMRAIEFMPSVGIGMCINLQRAAKQRGAATILYGMQPELAKVFSMMKLGKLFRFVDDDAALRKIVGD